MKVLKVRFRFLHHRYFSNSMSSIDYITLSLLFCFVIANIEERRRGKKKRRSYYRGPRCRRKSSTVRRSAVCSRTLRTKQQLKILVVGHNGSGKSSLINEILGQDIAQVGGLAQETAQKVVVKHRCKVGEIDVTIYDTRGFGDSSMTDQNTIDSIVDGIESIDIVLICHRLYDRVDGTAKKEMEVLVDSMDDDLVDLSILVFTFGDDYSSRSGCDSEYSDGRLTEDSKEKIKTAMEAQQYEIEGLFKDAMENNGITKEHTEQVPSCITCGIRKGNGEQKELPTSDNWVEDLWELIEQRCKPRARPLVRSTKNTIIRAISRVWSWATRRGPRV